MSFLSNRKFNVIEVDKHLEANIAKAELRLTGLQVDSRDEERDRRIETVLVMAAVPAVVFFIGKIGFFGLLLTPFCLAMFCASYAKPFLKFTGGSDAPIPLGERLDTAFAKIEKWIQSITDDLRDPRRSGRFYRRAVASPTRRSVQR
jgi:hypothetical protein